MTGPQGQPPSSAEETGAGDRPVSTFDGSAFRLRGEPPSVTRLSRKTLALAGGTAGIAIGAALLFALQPSGPKRPENLYSVDGASKAETVTSAPADYGNVPKLGPPLPGDLGRPIVAAQRDGETISVAPIGNPEPNPRTPVDEAREKARQEHEAAKMSRLFLGGSSVSGTGADTLRDALNTPFTGEPATQVGPQSPATARRAFLAGGPGKPFESAERIIPSSSPYVLQSGSVIPAALITGIRSDLPGQVTAQVTQNVYDSPTGRILLIPQGARLIGEYDSEIAAGQQRVLLAWDRLILPGGGSVRLDRQPGADIQGMAGLEDEVDNHWGRMLRAALISSLLSVGSELSSRGESDLVRALRSGVQEGTNEAGRRVVERELSVPPTLAIRPGFAFRVIVTRDLVLKEIDREARR